MPKLFPLIDAIPTWVIYALVLAGLFWYVRTVIRLSIASWCVVRYEWKYYQHRKREAAIAEERMQAQAERWQR